MIGMGWRAAAQSDSATPAAGVDPAAEYCVSVGGVVLERVPVWGANQPPDLRLTLDGPRLFCEFTGDPNADPPESQIAVDIDTLYADEPTLAALAYLTTPPLPEIPPGPNPASVYCAHLGGAEIGANTGAGGGWVAPAGSDPWFEVVSMCVFGDGSMIEPWGITYHTDGTIRGADLAPLFRYQPSEPPLVFPDQT
jgi:putative hemolysin